AADLRAALTDADPEIVRSAAFALANIGGDAAAAAVPVLREAVCDRDSNARRQASGALINLGPAGAPAIPELTKALTDPEPAVRGSAALALGNMDKAAVDVVPAIARLLDPSQPASVRRSAV